MPYKPAIDGLRALAVILVLLFHAKVSWFSGGYVGVDVFFVISGYLITKLILHEHGAGRFTLVRFYERRVRRIFPALFLVVLSTVAIATFVMLPPDLTRLGASVAATALFATNFYFTAQRLNYLQDKPEFEPLLHTWSLAIEEQFYLIFPIFVLGAMRVFKRLQYVFLAVALASLAISVCLTSTYPRAAFYSSSGRAWELLLGAWVATTTVKDLVPRRLIPALQWAGLAAVAGATVSYDARMPFPGFAALLPCVGTALLIAWCDQESKLVRGLSHPAFVGLGLISYPLYLWHWPLLVLARLALLREPTTLEVAVIYLFAGVLAAATWLYLEKPIRAGRGLAPAKRIFASAAAVSGLALVLGAALHAGEGSWAAPPPPHAARILAAARDYSPSLGKCHGWDRKSPDQLSACIIGATDRREFDFVLWGDSHAGAVVAAVDAVARSVAKKGLQLTTDGCPPVLRTQGLPVATDCGARNQAAFDLLRLLGIRRAILMGRWIEYFIQDKVRMSSNEPDPALQRALMETINRLRSIGIDVTVMGPVPDIGWNVPSVLAAKASRKEPLPQGPSLSDFMQGHRSIITTLKILEREDVHVAYPHEQLCQPTCLVHLNGEVLYSDSEHLTTRGADLLRPVFVRQLSRP